MPKFYDLYEQALFEAKEMFNFNGMKVFPTAHSIEREVERMSTDSKDVIEYITQKASQKLFLRKEKAQYLVYSTKKQQGIVIDHRENPQDSDKKLHIFLITILPKKKKHAKLGTRLLMVESLKKEYEIENILLIDD